ncbi:MAG: thioredoxin family protein [Planctomycetaceae bacterium]|nr:thioredoxin family protein [Planctomycetaceae bacterium]
MSTQRIATSGITQYTILISLASLLIGCSESNESVDSGALPDSPAVESLTTDAAPAETQSSQLPTDVTPANATVVTPTEDAEPIVPSPTKPQREPIYVEEANGQELIAAALKKARRDHKHVLIEWGGNWCGWCYKLHDVFHNDPEVHPIVHEEFVLVLIDSGENQELMLEYGGKDRQYSFPHLTVLDEQGSVLTNQETGSLEEGPRHDPKLVTQFLHNWVPEKIDAEQLLADSLMKAAAEDKHLLIRVGTPYCGWCNVLAQFVQDHESLIATDYVDIKIDTMRMMNGEQVAARLSPEKSGGVPWMVILDASGKELASSHGPDGNIGYPYQPNEIAHFITMLRDSRKNLTDANLDTIAADLNAYRDEREAKKQ